MSGFAPGRPSRTVTVGEDEGEATQLTTDEAVVDATEAVSQQESELTCNDLVCYHSGCYDAGLARDGACVAAISRYCGERGFGLGIPQELGNNVIGSLCSPASLRTDIMIGELTARHSGCNQTYKAHQADCMAAVHRSCQARGYSAGTAQEVSPDRVGVACFQAGSYSDIELNELRQRHGGCDDPGKSQSNDCMAAIHRACNARGFSGEISQEVGYRSDRGWLFGVACFNGSWFEAPVKSLAERALS